MNEDTISTVDTGATEAVAFSAAAVMAIYATATVSVVGASLAIGLDYPSMLFACGFTGAALQNAGVDLFPARGYPENKEVSE